MPLPDVPVNTSATPDPIEALPAPTGEARLSGAYAGLERTLGISLETQGIGKAMGGAWVPFDQASKLFTDNGYDPNVLPKGGASQGEISAIMNQQSAIKRNEAIMRQSDLGSFEQGASEFVGGAGDPLFLAAGPVIGRLGFAVKGMGIGGRVATGAGEGAVINGGYTVGQKFLGTAPGDHDISTGDIVKSVLVGGVFGGALHGALGPRAAPPTDVSGYLNMIRSGEDTATASKISGVPIDQVTSKKGAVGLHQVMPGTARDMMPELRGKSDAEVTEWLKNPANNEAASTAYLTKLHKQFGDDPEAIAVGYNAGPGVAAKFVKAGHDRSMLPEETRQYLNRIAKSGGKESFGSASPYRPNTFSMDWTNGEDLTPAVQANASDAIKAAGTDAATPDAHIQFKGLAVEANMVSRGELGESSPIWYNTKPAGLSDEYMGRFGGITESLADHKISLEEAKAEFERQGGHIPADWADKLPEFFREGGPVSRLVKFDTDGAAPKANDGSIRPAAPPLPEDFHQGLMQRWGIGTKYGPKPVGEAVEPKPQMPEPGSAFTEHPTAQAALKDMETRPQGGTPDKEAAALQQHTTDAIQEAEHAHSLTNAAKEEGAESPVADHAADAEEALHAAGYSPEMVKAVTAAIRCGVVKGLG